MTKLILIRHGKTSDNESLRYCGSIDTPLSDYGKKQGQMLYGAMKDKCVNVVYSSDLLRAYETAKITFPNIEIIHDISFREMHFGLFEGYTYEELMSKYNVEYQLWLEDPVKNNPPKGESLIDVRTRVLSSLNNILTRHKDQTVAIVSHGGPIKIILSYAIGNGIEKFWDIKQDWGKYSIIDYSSTGKANVVTLNEEGFSNG